MASVDLESPWLSSSMESFDGSLDIHIEEVNSAYSFDSVDSMKSAIHCSSSIPQPPPMPSKICQRTNKGRQLPDSCYVPKETKDTWDNLFKEGCGADVNIIAGNESVISAHYSVLSVASPALGNFLQQAKVRNGIRYIKIPGVPYCALYVFIRFLYSSCYDEGEMEKCVLHLLVLSHSFSVPSLKKVCVNHLEQGWLTKENVIDVLQLARKCDAPRLSFMCVRMIIKDFKIISSTEGWKVMKRANPALEQELLESVVEADSRGQTLSIMDGHG